MNIFYLDKEPYRAAQYHCDKHVVKMILEYSQLLSTAHHVLDVGGGSIIDHAVIYKPTHVNHPSAKWVRESDQNYIWLWYLLAACHSQYQRRYEKVHASLRLLKILIPLPTNIPKASFIEPPQCMPDDCKVEGNAVVAYRKLYLTHKAHICKWNHGPTPDWYKYNDETEVRVCNHGNV